MYHLPTLGHNIPFAYLAPVGKLDLLSIVFTWRVGHNTPQELEEGPAILSSTINYIFLSASPRIQVKSEVDLRMGVPAKIECLILAGYPEPTVKWTKSGAIVPSDHPTHLLFEKPTKETEGIYTVEVSFYDVDLFIVFMIERTVDLLIKFLSKFKYYSFSTMNAPKR